MQARVSSGKYILAVSGGVDSMSLMHTLSKRKPVELVIAHFNHGIRTDAHLDEQLVKEAARRYGLPAEFGYGKLGRSASEEAARIARYDFLESLRKKHSAGAIITAHHQDDLIETAFLNLLRGSGRRGLSAISSSEIVRPLLGVPKKEILDYAKKHDLQWREDSSNSDDRYLRNYLRKALAGLSAADKRRIIANLTKVTKINKDIDLEVATLSQNIKNKGVISRQKFIELPQNVSDELVVYWLREMGITDYDKKKINSLGVAIKTARPRTSHQASRQVSLEVDKKTARLVTTD